MSPRPSPDDPRPATPAEPRTAARTAHEPATARGITTAATSRRPVVVDTGRAPDAASATGRAASVLICPTPAEAPPSERFSAALPAIITTYTEPGDRVLLADTPKPAPSESDPAGRDRDCRDRLIETVLRLGRGATTDPTEPARHQPRLAASATRPAGQSESGLRPGPVPAAGATADSPLTDPGAPPDRFALIVAGASDRPQTARLLADLATRLASDGTLAVLTHSHNSVGSVAEITASGTTPGLALTDRLLVAHERPNPAPPTPGERHLIAEHGHRRTHSTVLVFRPNPIVPGGC